MTKTIRLQNWDYRNNGWYFVTICTRDRVCYFGDIVDCKMELSAIGKIARAFWQEIPQHSRYTSLDAYVLMPNHIHGIVIIDRPDNSGRDVIYNVPTEISADLTEDDFYQKMSKLSPKAGSLSVIMRSYKAAVSHSYRENGYSNFAWQPRFYESIIRSERDLENIQNYIVNNPANWSESKDNPINFEM
ncbi:transposase [Oscillatoria sp. FACHB-1406]|uniref:transposase n=1 Tax=Oscillatoria sp. FACHB-1406 TaxID=2692846 RepID=UPI001682A97E|nr:transposase [Oscillatoria sp. FACHB-1406]MBD2578776.1 transposase [Oscillatoria sp. FACHB-1406]